MPKPSKAQSYGAIALLFLAVVLLTAPQSYSDTNMYAADIQHAASITEPHLWDFGHLLWRPTGWLANELTERWTRPRIGQSYFAVFPPLIAINLAAGLASVLLAFFLAEKVSGSTTIAFAVSTGLLVSSAFLNMSQTGTAYVPGLAMQLAGIALVVSAAKTGRLTWGAACTAGAALAVSCTLWVAYLFSLPGAAVLAIVWRRDSLALNTAEGRQRLVFVARLTVATLIIGTLLYGMAAAVLHVDSVAGLHAWISDAGHGYAQTRNWLRIGAGIPRAFLDLGNDGMTIKRYMLGDPYAQTTLWDLLTASLWKILLVHCVLGLTLFGLATTQAGRKLLLPLAASAAGLLSFALAYEAGSAERYLPLYPMLIVVVAYLCRDFSWRRPTQAALAILLVAMIGVNLPNYAVATARQQFEPDIDRIEAAKQVLPPASRVVLLSFRDGIHDFYHRFPFHPLALETQLPVYYLTDPMDAQAGQWPQRVSQAIRRAWDQDGEVWVSKRLFADKPQPEWGWVEKDNPELIWSEVVEYFQKLETDKEIGGPDGFRRLRPKQ
ncbi:MAG: hypothetical protein WD733_23190 [Bryobacterales bacterium]